MFVIQAWNKTISSSFGCVGFVCFLFHSLQNDHRIIESKMQISGILHTTECHCRYVSLWSSVSTINKSPDKTAVVQRHAWGWVRFNGLLLIFPSWTSSCVPLSSWWSPHFFCSVRNNPRTLRRVPRGTWWLCDRPTEDRHKLSNWRKSRDLGADWEQTVTHDVVIVFILWPLTEVHSVRSGNFIDLSRRSRQTDQLWGKLWKMRQ